MTHIDKSESQNIAEAAGEKVALSDLIAAHRIAFRSDILIPRLHDRSGEDPGEGEAEPPADPQGHTGMPYTVTFRRFLNGDYGAVYPWMKAYSGMRDRCRRTHSRGHHERPEWRGSLCGELTSMVIRRDYLFERAVYEMELTRDRAERVLRSALGDIERRMDEARERQRGVSYAGVWPPEPTPAHHFVPGAHDEECPHPECVARRAA